MRTDAWGWRARLGILVIDKDPVAESEFWAMAPSGVTVHAARFGSPRTPGTDSYGDDPGQVVAESPEVGRGLDILGQMELDVICLCFVTSSFLGGFGFDDSFAAKATGRAHGTRVTTVASAITSAAQATGVHRPFLVVPPWFKDGIVTAARGYLSDAGLSPAGWLRHDLGRGWRELQPWQTWDEGAQWIVSPQQLYRQVREHFPEDADSVVIAGSGFRSLDVMWYSYRPGSAVEVITPRDSRKAALIRRAGRASLCVQSDQVPYQYVTVEGPVEIQESVTIAERRALARRYLGELEGDRFVDSSAGMTERMILIRIEPSHWLSQDQS